MKLKHLPTRHSLISRLKDWDDWESWREFANLYSLLIYGTALRSGLNHAEAEDVMQETLTSVAMHMRNRKSRYDPQKGKFKAWLLQMTTWRIYDEFRKRRSDKLVRETDQVEGHASEIINNIPDTKIIDPGEHWDEMWEYNLFDAAVERVKQRIDPKHFQVFDLCIRQELKPGKVAPIVNLSSLRVSVIKHRVSKKVQKEIELLRTYEPSMLA